MIYIHFIPVFLEHLFIISRLAHQEIRKIKRKQITIVAPVGIFNSAAANSPTSEPTMLIIDEATSCCLKFL